MRTALAAALEAAGHSVRQAPDGRKALALFRAEPADLILTDLIMPEQEGLELIVQLHREIPALPIIAMSGSARNSKLYLDMALKLGAARRLSKPFTPATLLRVIDDLLSPRPPPNLPPP